MSNIHLNIAKNWNELNFWQLKKLALLFVSKNKGLFFDYRVLFILMNIRFWQFWKYRKIYKIINNVRIADLKPNYKWIYDSVNLTTFPKIRKKNLSPADRLADITIDELAHADDLYLGWVRSKKKIYLQYLCAVLYSIPDSNGKRIVFEKEDLTKRAKFFKKVPLSTLLVVSMAYVGSKNHIINQFPALFLKSKNKVQTKAKMPHSSGFGKLILQFSGQKFGTYNETKLTNIYTFFGELNEQVKIANNGK